MPTFHHVNLAVPPERIDEQIAFLTGVLGLSRVELTEEERARGVRWFAFDGGGQVHLSLDADFVPSRAAHVAVEVEDPQDIARRAEAAGLSPTAGTGNPQIVLFTDPSGNRWELRPSA